MIYNYYRTERLYLFESNKFPINTVIKLESNPLERNTFKFIINLKFRITAIFQERKSSGDGDSNGGRR